VASANGAATGFARDSV